METAPDIVSTQAGYDRWAEIYDGEDNTLILVEEQHIQPLIGRVKGLSVADIGCGTGRHAIQLANAGAKVTAVDFSKSMLARAQQKPGAENITFLQHDLAQPFPLPSASFDRVLCCLVLDHIANLHNFFTELRRLCRPDGYIVISVMHPAMSLRGVQARFTDPATGQKILLQSEVHQTCDYLMAAKSAGLKMTHISEHAVDEAMAKRIPRAEKYLNWPVLLLLRFTP